MLFYTVSCVDPFSLHVSFDVEPYLPELDKNITTTSFQYHNVRIYNVCVITTGS